MKRRLATLLLLALVAACDKSGVYHYGVPSDVVEPCGPRASVFLRSAPADLARDLPDRTEILIVGSSDPLDVVAPPAVDEAGRCYIDGYVARSSSTFLRYGTYERASDGQGIAHIASSFVFEYQPQIDIGGRLGAGRYDDPFDVPFSLVGASGDIDVDMAGEVRRFVPLGKVLDAIDPTTMQGAHDLYQVYNLSLFFGQVRIPAFGGIGMTRYISSPTAFRGLIGGELFIKVESLSNPNVTIEYREDPLFPGIPFQDFPSVSISGAQITRVNLMGNGDMTGALAFEIHDSDDPSIVRFAGAVDYGTVTIGNGVANGGTYTITTTIPSVTSHVLPYSLASNVDLTAALPYGP